MSHLKEKNLKKELLKGFLIGTIILITIAIINRYIVKYFPIKYIYFLVPTVIGGLAGATYKYVQYHNNQKIKHLYEKLQEEKEKYLESAEMDEMTDTYCKKDAILILQEEINLAKIKKNNLTICFININNIKKITQTNTISEAENIIIRVSKILKKNLDKKNLLCRMEKNKFLIIMPNCNIKFAENIWNQIKEDITELNQKENKPHNISLSHGCETYKYYDDINLENFLHLADMKMYKEKQELKNNPK